MSQIAYAARLMLSHWTQLTPRAAADDIAETLDGVARSTRAVLAEDLRRRARELEGVVVPASDVLNELAAELEGKSS